MSQKAKREYLNEIKLRYKKVRKAEKKKILNEFCEVCGYNRKYAIHLLNKKESLTISKKKRCGRKRNYNNPVIIHFLRVMLKAIRQLADSKRLQPIIPLWMPFYEKTFCIKIAEPIKKK